MTTYAESLGLKVGDKIRYLGGENCKDSASFNVGDILTLCRDDDTIAPHFILDGEDNAHPFLLDRNWEKVEEQDVNSTPPITKDTIVNVQFTMEELFLIYTTVGSTCTRRPRFHHNVYDKIKELLLLSDEGMDCYICDTTLEIEAIKYNQWVDSHFMSSAKAKAIGLRKQAEELIRQAEGLECK